MELKPNMSLSEIREYLQGNLKESIRNDIWPIVQPDVPQGGYFGVARAVLCYVNFLGALYEGYKGEKDGAGRRKIATSPKAEAFVANVLGDVDDLYRANGKLLYEMYRHGTVHLYRPNSLLAPDKRVLKWLAYKGEREKWEIVKNRARRLRHLKPLAEDENSAWLPVSITCLYDDLLAAIDEFARRLSTDQQLFDKWNSAASALCEPECTKESW